MGQAFNIDTFNELLGNVLGPNQTPIQFVTAAGLASSSEWVTFTHSNAWKDLDAALERTEAEMLRRLRTEKSYAELLGLQMALDVVTSLRSLPKTFETAARREETLNQPGGTQDA